MSRRRHVMALVAAWSMACGGAQEPLEEVDAGEVDAGGDVGGEVVGDVADRSCREDTSVIRRTPSDHTEYVRAGFTRVAELETTAGPIRIYAQDQVSDLMILRAYGILRFYLEDVPGSEYGADKAAVAETMGRHGAVLMMPNGTHEEGNEPNLPAQPLYQNEITVEGSRWYVENDYEHRDATLEEIFHLVHDAGIGTNRPGALPAYQAEMLAQARAAIADGRWGIATDPGVSDWLAELDAEGSLAQEYIASVIDSYYGLWAPWTEAPGGMWGVYVAKDRAEVLERDPEGARLLRAFLPEMLGHDARIAPEFEGTFEMNLVAERPYTHKSRYLVNAILTGDRASNLSGNAADNRLRGNAADNVIDGGEGRDTVIYCGARGSYTIEEQAGSVSVSGPDGVDTLSNVEVLHFADEIVLIEEL